MGPGVRRDDTAWAYADPAQRSVTIYERLDRVICPVQPHFQKFSRSHLTQIKSISLAVSSLWRGVSRWSRTRDGMRWTRQRRARNVMAGRASACERSNGVLTNGAFADGKSC